MPLSDTYVRLPLSAITVKREERQRREIETADLQLSIRQIGLINPIIVREEGSNYFVLVAGERRLEAFKALGLPDIPVRFAHQLSPIESAIIELEENIKRKDLPWIDLVRAVHNLHQLHTVLDANWTQSRTAEALSMTDGTVSLYLKVEPFLEDPRILECATVRQAYDVIDRRDKRSKAIALSALFELDPEDDEIEDYEEEEPIEDIAAEIALKQANGELDPLPVPVKPRVTISKDILNADFLEWAPSYSGRRFNFLHVDFPYGNVGGIGPQMQGNEHTMYEDNPDLYVRLLTCFCENLEHFFAEAGWCMFWYSERMGTITRETIKFKAPSLHVQVHPLIWVHSDNAGISPDPQRRPRHIYDTCLLMSRGDIPLVRIKADAYASPTDHRLHPSTKPEPMLRHFFEMFIDSNMSVFDPTCGSGAALRAAESLGAHRVLGLELDWNYCEAARKALQDSRIMRSLTPSMPPLIVPAANV